MLKSIQLTNFLSYGEQALPLELRPLNVLIGPNSSGKSNLVEALEVLKATPKNLRQPIRDGGGVQDWLWKGATANATAKIEVVVESQGTRMPLRYVLSFSGDKQQRLQLADERLENECPQEGYVEPYFYYRYQNGNPVLLADVEASERRNAAASDDHSHQPKRVERRLKHEDVDHTESILSQRKDPDQYPELAAIGDFFTRIGIYREWAFGRYTNARMPQRGDMPNDHLAPDASNLGLVLSGLRLNPPVKKRMLEQLKVLYSDFEDFEIKVEGGSVQVFFEETGRIIPGTRLSDGTLRYLCLLAVLCHPEPAPLICIEEPELGLHPDALNSLARLMVEASQRTQIIVTTHSDFLVDFFTNTPEVVVVVDRTADGTSLKRLDADELRPWVAKERLGALWMSGEIGGVRW